MIRRVVTAYLVEIQKALHAKSTYVGPLLIILVMALMPMVDRVERDQVSDYGFAARSTGVALNLLGLLLVLTYCASLVSSEIESGTIRLALVRPLRRYEFLAAKLLLGATYALALVVLVALLAWGGLLLFGDTQGVTYGGEVVFTNHTMIRSYLLALVLTMAPLCAAVAFAVAMSTVAKSTGAAIGATVAIWFAGDILKYPLHIAPFLFSTYIESPLELFANQADAFDPQWFPMALYCIATSLAWGAAAVALAVLVLRRRSF